MPLGTAFEALLALNYNSFILTVGVIIGVAIYSIEVGGGGDIEYLILSLEICMVTILLEIPSMHKLVQYFQSVFRNEDM